VELRNGSRIQSLPGKEATIRGYSGVDLLIVDEASRVTDDLYNAIRPMLAVSDGRLALLSTPFGRRGFFFNVWERGEDWKKIRITAKQCPRITEEFLKRERASMPHWFYRQEYECSFEESQAALFDWEEVEAAAKEEVKQWKL
jgi:superfamily II DNA or RNA helicase